MARNLVIVESPTKVKPIKKFLGSNYTVAASNGHVRDLPKSQMGIDVDKDFEPKYITIRGKGELLASLRKQAKAADKIFLATDPDREGEAISWHLTYALNLPPEKTYRITFNEITKEAVKESIKNARAIDMDLVDAQQARRALDRVVGYEISPVLWKKVKRGLSAGRVQSVALRIIADREAEIDAFVPEEYWSLDVALKAKGEKKPLTAHFFGTEEGKMTLNSQSDVDKVTEALQGAAYQVLDIKNGNRTRKAPLPFTTSTLQQEANKALNFSAVKTMRIAQQLYEGVDLKSDGTVGLISYLRTDSTRISETADAAARAYVEEKYGKENLAGASRTAKNDKKIQDAHEAIRPTDITRTPIAMKAFLSRDQYRLYQLIWNRFTASRMADANYETTALRVEANGYIFTVNTSRLAFPGFMTVYTSSDEDSKDDRVLLNNITEETEFEWKDFDAEQHFTQPPAHYTESSLIKTLEELGVGRPSTYAPTISTIIARRYVSKEGKNIFITEIGEVVDSIMQQSFPEFVDVNFTAEMEKELDQVEEGELSWKEVLRRQYPVLEQEVKKAQKDLEKITIADEVSDEICECCGRNMVIKFGSFGKFLACPGFPECRNTKPFLEKIGVACPKCGGEVVIRKTRKGRRYYGCEHNPECDYMSWQKPASDK